MEMSSHFIRASVESALARRFQVLGEHIRAARTNEGSSTLVDKYITDDMDYFRSLIPSYWLRLNRIRSPLLSLPPELLPMILDATASDRRTQLITWIKLGHVCHDLRDTLLRMHALWAEVVFDPRYTHVQEELLARAGSYPITISLGYPRTSQRALRAVELLDRARKVEVHSFTPPDQAKSILEALRQGLNPDLEVLDFSFDHDAAIAQGITSVSANQPRLIAPKLCAVKFANIFIPVDMSCLRDLSLAWYTTDPTPIPDARTFTDMISSCGLLEKLTLHGCIPAYSALESLFQSGYRISLPRLTHLELQQQMEHILAFWNILNIPISTTIDVHYQSAPEEEWACDLRDLLVRTRSLRAFLSQTQRRGVSQISKIGVCYNDEGQLSVKLGTADSGLPTGTDLGSHQTPLRPWNSSRDYMLGFSTYTEVENPDEIVSFLECLCLTLQLHADTVDTVAYDWSTTALALGEQNQGSRILYPLFPATTTFQLSIDYPCEYNDIGWILGSSSPQGLDYFPKLQALHLDQLFSQAEIEHLIGALTMRTSCGSPVHVLTLREHFLHLDLATEMEEEVAEEQCSRRLEALVPHVRFDAFE